MRGAVALALVLCGGAAWAEPVGYLPLLGPGPLRFQSAPKPVSLASLPPLSMGEAMAEKSEKPDTKPAATNETATAVEKIQPPVPLEARAPDVANTNKLVVVTPFVLPGESSPVQVSPQALMKFFQTSPTGTNRPEAVVLVPLEFVPPTPLVPPPSKATFEIK